jgi:uncharacterized protein (TIGR02588 family)
MKKLEKNWLEWICFAVSLLLVISLLAYLAYDALSTGKSPPRIEFQLGPPQQREGKFLVNVIAENHGEQTAEGVHVEVLLKSDGKEERGRFVIDHLPKQGRRSGFVIFDNDPSQATTLQARALGYAEP